MAIGPTGALMSKQLQGTRYVQMVEKAREIYDRQGSTLLHQPTDINTFYKTGDIIFTFYDAGLSTITTPEGLITPLGSRIGGNEDAAHAECIEYFGLELILETNRNHEHYQTYKATKNIPK